MSKYFHSTTSVLRTIPSWDYTVAYYTASLIAVGSALRLSFNLGYNYGVFKSLEGSHLNCCINFLEGFLIPVATGFIVTAVGLGRKRAVGFFVSLLTLTVISGFYVLWYISTLSIMKEYKVQDFSQLAGQHQYLIPLHEATWWDLVVLVITAILLIWHVKTLLVVRRNARSIT